jgi:hypothetical protein
MNRYTVINQEGRLAQDGAGAIPVWHSRPNAREAARDQDEKWSVITVGSRRYHGGLARTLGPTEQPTLDPQDEPEEEPEA